MIIAFLNKQNKFFVNILKLETPKKWYIMQILKSRYLRFSTGSTFEKSQKYNSIHTEKNI